MAGTSNVENDQFSFSSSSFSVQELVKEPIKTIPQHYVRQPVPSAPCGGRPSQMLPTIDMNRLVSGKDFDVELGKLHSTCKDWGFFQLVNHGINSSILEKVKQEVEGFYQLPLEEKMKFRIREGDAEAEGYGSTERDGGKFDWADRFFMTTNPIHKRKPHLFPQLPSSLRIIHFGSANAWEEASMFNGESFGHGGERNDGIFSNGVYRSIEHKVVPNVEKERMSVVFFINPKFDVEVGPSPSLINPLNPPLFKRVSLDQYVKGFVSQKLNGKSHLHNMRIDNCH
ncbi:hypothetical protein V6N11_032528 [Hibiscus sabdariffa]|uniref:Uncharacterized protein n=1 Tax=Hibiscus sabdariffa TaxID=183260 RepID=A0ABR2T0X4_9ROSI